MIQMLTKEVVLDGNWLHELTWYQLGIFGAYVRDARRATWVEVRFGRGYASPESFVCGVRMPGHEFGRLQNARVLALPGPGRIREELNIVAREML